MKYQCSEGIVPPKLPPGDELPDYVLETRSYLKYLVIKKNGVISCPVPSLERLGYEHLNPKLSKDS
jgi:hypothetical protein